MDELERIAQLSEDQQNKEDYPDIAVENGDTVIFREDNGDSISIKLEPEEVNKFNEYIEECGVKQLSQIFESDTFNELPDPKKVDVYSQIMRNAVREARTKIEVDRYHERNR